MAGDEGGGNAESKQKIKRPPQETKISVLIHFQHIIQKQGMCSQNNIHGGGEGKRKQL